MASAKWRPFCLGLNELISWNASWDTTCFAVIELSQTWLSNDITKWRYQYSSRINPYNIFSKPCFVISVYELHIITGYNVRGVEHQTKTLRYSMMIFFPCHQMTSINKSLLCPRQAILALSTIPWGRYQQSGRGDLLQGHGTQQQIEQQLLDRNMSYCLSCINTQQHEHLHKDIKYCHCSYLVCMNLIWLLRPLSISNLRFEGCKYYTRYT